MALRRTLGVHYVLGIKQLGQCDGPNNQPPDRQTDISILRSLQ